MSYRIGGRYIGTPSLQISTVMHECIPPKPEGWAKGYECYKLAFLNTQACTIIINNETELYLREGQGFTIDYRDAPIRSLVVKESGIQYNLVAGVM